jgi:hypothetical protein
MMSKNYDDQTLYIKSMCLDDSQQYLLRSTFADPEPISTRINVCYRRPLVDGIEREKVNFGDVCACLT